MVENEETKAEQLPREELEREAERLLLTAKEILTTSPLLAQTLVATFFGKGDFFPKWRRGHIITEGLPKEVSFTKGRFQYWVVYEEDEEKVHLEIGKRVLSTDPEDLRRGAWTSLEEVHVGWLIKEKRETEDLSRSRGVIQFTKDFSVFLTNTRQALAEAERFLKGLEEDLK